MPTRRSSGDAGLDLDAVDRLLEIGDRRLDALLRVRGERLEIDHGVVGERFLQIGNGRARGGAEQAERRFATRTSSAMSVSRMIWFWRSSAGLPQT